MPVAWTDLLQTFFVYTVQNAFLHSIDPQQQGVTVGTTPSNRREEDLLMIAFKLIWLMHAACKGAMIQPVISWASEIMSIVD